MSACALLCNDQEQPQNSPMEKLQAKREISGHACVLLNILKNTRYFDG